MRTDFNRTCANAAAALALLCAPFLGGCDPGVDKPEAHSKPAAPAPSSPLPPRNIAAEEEDVTADKPDASKPGPQSTPLMEEITPSGPLSKKASRCYALQSEIKSNVELIGRDLDNRGKEVTRLLRTSDALSKNITDLAELWSDAPSFRDLCITAKRAALLLNDELSRAPRKWTHVRWSYNSMIDDIRKLRSAAREMAEAEPKPGLLVDKSGKPVLDKEGKPVYAEQPPPGVDPAIARRDEKVREVQAAREKIRQAEEAKKTKHMPTDLDGN